MPSKPLIGLGGVRSPARSTRRQKVARSAGALREVRMKNLEKARRQRKKNLLAKKKAAR